MKSETFFNIKVRKNGGPWSTRYERLLELPGTEELRKLVTESFIDPEDIEVQIMEVIITVTDIGKPWIPIKKE